MQTSKGDIQSLVTNPLVLDKGHHTVATTVDRAASGRASGDDHARLRLVVGSGTAAVIGMPSGIPSHEPCHPRSPRGASIC